MTEQKQNIKVVGTLKEFNQMKRDLKKYKSKQKEMLDKFEKMLDECSVPVMDEDEMTDFIEANKESSVYRIVNYDKLKTGLQKLKGAEK